MLPPFENNRAAHFKWPAVQRSAAAATRHSQWSLRRAWNRPGISVKFGATTIASGGSHSFDGAVNLGQQTSATVTITNTGRGPLTGIAASLAPAGGVDFALGAAPPVTIAADASTTFNVIFSPQALGSRTATLSVSSNADPSPYIIQLVGTGMDDIKPVISPGATSLTIVDGAAGSTETLNAWLANHGTAAAMDNSEAFTWKHDFTTLPGPCGTPVITFRATDASGNFSTTAAVLTVVDNTAPVLTAPAAGLTVESDGHGNDPARPEL